MNNKKLYISIINKMNLYKYIILSFLGFSSGHFFFRQGIEDVQNFLLESRMQEVLWGSQQFGKVCSMDDGPFCNGLEFDQGGE